jgi:hypothetical protein
VPFFPAYFILLQLLVLYVSSSGAVGTPASYAEVSELETQLGVRVSRQVLYTYLISVASGKYSDSK